jgi:hypothetical protein
VNTNHFLDLNIIPMLFSQMKYEAIIAITTLYICIDEEHLIRNLTPLKIVYATGELLKRNIDEKEI